MRDSNDQRFASGQPFMRLHDLAAQFGDGLIPELYDLYTREINAMPRGDNIVAFPGKAGGVDEVGRTFSSAVKPRS